MPPYVKVTPKTSANTAVAGLETASRAMNGTAQATGRRLLAAHHAHCGCEACAGDACGEGAGGGQSTGREDYDAGTGNSAKAFGGTAGMVPLLTRYDASWGPGPGFGNGGGNVTYSFAPPTGAGGISMSAAGRATIVEAMRIISEVADITFSWADSGDFDGVDSLNGQLDVYAQSGSGLSGVGGWNGRSQPGSTWEITSGYVNLRGVDTALYLHEIMHALGVAHPGEYDGSGFSYAADAPYWDDSEQFTLMSYWSERETGANYAWKSPDTLQLYDIAALQAIYGANTTTRASDTVYGFNGTAVRASDGAADAIWRLADANDTMIGSIWDAGGTDTLDLSGYASASVIDLREGGFSSFGGLTKNLSIGYGAVIENAVGGAGADRITGNAAANVLDGRGGSDTIYAGGGADRIVVGATDIVYGDQGSDTAVVAGFSRGTNLNFRWDDRLDVSGLRADVYLASVENLEFRDGALLTGNAAIVQRLYDTVFARDADGSGLATWTATLDGGASLAQVATSFVASGEFQATYGALDDGGFVTLLYRNVLDRAPDQAGFDYWTGELAGRQARADVVAGFSESAEHVASMASSLARGATWLGDAAAETVARLYLATFERNPDEGGLASWLDLLGSGTSKVQMAESFAASAEFQATYGALDNGGFVDLMYVNVLDRQADAGGRATWTDALDSGSLTRGAVLDGFAQSGEFIARTEARFDDGIVFA